MQSPKLKTSLPLHQTISLVNSDSDTDWEGSNYPKLAMPMKTNCATMQVECSQWLPGKIKTLCSVESNCESESSSEDCFEENAMCDEDLMQLDYAEFCKGLAKLPDMNDATSAMIYESVISTSFNHSVINDEDESEDDAEEESDDEEEDDEEEEEEEDEEENSFTEDFDSFSCFGQHEFDPFAISGLYMPSLFSVQICGTISFCDENSGCSDKLSKKLEEVNEKWHEAYASSDNDSVDGVAIFSNGCCATDKKSVHFSSQTTFIDILNNVEWAADYEDARKGPWEQYYRDSQRFANRIESVGEVLSRILDTDHRAKIFRNQFESSGLVNDTPMNSHQVTPML